MKNNILRSSALSLFLLIMVSCDKEDQSVKVNSLMPINTGNSWTYKYTYFNNHEENIDTTVITIGESVTINGYNCFAAVDDSPFDAKFLVGNDENGNIVNYGGISDIDTLITPSIEFKKDAKNGDVWEYKMVYMDWDTGKFSESTTPVKCISVDTLITTPKGNFHCMAFEISINSGDHIFKHYLSMNVGRVKSEHYEGDYLFSYSELIEYKIN